MTNEELQQVIAQADFRLDKMKDDIHDLFDENKQLKERIDKAIEYIEHTELYEVAYDDEGNYFNTYDDKATADLLQILGDKENE